MYCERVCEEVAVDAVGYRRQAYYGAAFFPGRLAAATGDVRCVQVVLSLREVFVMRLDGADGEDSDLVFSLFDAVEVCGGKVPLVDFVVIVFHRRFFAVKAFCQERHLVCIQKAVVQVEFGSLLFAHFGGRLESAPFLFSGDVIARADEAEHLRDFFSASEAGVAFGLHCLELFAEDVIEVLIGGLVSFPFGVEE